MRGTKSNCMVRLSAGMQCTQRWKINYSCFSWVLFRNSGSAQFFYSTLPPLPSTNLFIPSLIDKHNNWQSAYLLVSGYLLQLQLQPIDPFIVTYVLDLNLITWCSVTWCLSILFDLGRRAELTLVWALLLCLVMTWLTQTW